MPSISTSGSLTALLKSTPPVKIVNVGAAAYMGEKEPYERLIEAGYAELVGFEPNPQEFAKLRQDPRRRFLPFFIGNGEPATYFETNNPWTGSIFEPNTPLVDAFSNLGIAMNVQKLHPVVTHRLDDIAELTEMDFLKVDVQGAELAVMKGGERLLNNCLVIQTEVEFVPLYKQQPLFADIDTYLRERGFLFHTFAGISGRCLAPFVINGDLNEPANQILWADAVFVRDFRQFRNMTSDQLRKLAIILNDLYGSADFCLQILMELDRRDGTDMESAYLEILPQG